MKLFDWVFRLPSWLGTLIFISPFLLIIVGASTLIISTSMAQTEEARVQCEAAGGELLKATGKSGDLACVKKEYILDWKGK